jgi:YYY domain-containing protein
MGNDFWIVFRWWGTLFLVGAVAFPITKKLFSSWFDKGYIFSKAIGMALITFLVYLAGIVHLFPFTVLSIIWAMVVVFIAGVAIRGTGDKSKAISKRELLKIFAEEVFFFSALLFWSWIKGHEASVHGLEKFMDFGFTKSILNSSYFPAPDMWYAGLSINYYYFGHTVMAMLTRLSGLDLAYTFNLMLSGIFAFTFTMSFSIAYQLLVIGLPGRLGIRGRTIGSLVTAYLVTLAGNMQTIYAFTKGYFGEQTPPPYWTLLWKFSELKNSIGLGLDKYWYANATRFIPFTIHEFPSYSFVVSDVHGHVLSLPFVLLAIALLLELFGFPTNKVTRHDLKIADYGWLRIGFYGFLCGVLFMTNTVDGPLYLGLFIVLFMVRYWNYVSEWKKHIRQKVSILGAAIIPAILVSLPFMVYFNSFVTGLAVNCPPGVFANHKIGPILFEGVEKCQHSPLWMMWLLWGFFIYCGVFFIASKIQRIKLLKFKHIQLKTNFTQLDTVLSVFFIFSIFLIIFPEFFYFKDIYPAHFRSNTMFKLGYDAFILFSIVSGYTIVRAFVNLRFKIYDLRFTNKIFLILLIPQLFLVSIYPLFSVRSYFDSLRHYQGLYGLTWLQNQFSDDYAGIQWLNTQVLIRKSANASVPVIVEADGDSYTDYERYSAFTGLPTIVGWAVHEWLWRGSYDVVAPRREEVRAVYESDSIEETRKILAKYNVSYIIVGTFELEKYPTLNLSKFAQLGKLVFSQGVTKIYALTMGE